MRLELIKINKMSVQNSMFIWGLFLIEVSAGLLSQQLLRSKVVSSYRVDKGIVLGACMCFQFQMITTMNVHKRMFKYCVLQSHILRQLACIPPPPPTPTVSVNYRYTRAGLKIKIVRWVSTGRISRTAFLRKTGPKSNAGVWLEFWSKIHVWICSML